MPLQMRGLKNEPNIKYLSMKLKLSTVSKNVQTILVYGMISKNLQIPQNIQNNFPFLRTFFIFLRETINCCLSNLNEIFGVLFHWNKQTCTVVGGSMERGREGKF